MQLNLISFGRKYHFLQNQFGLLCAYCGKPTLSEMEFKKIDKLIQGKHGSEIADVLQPYVSYFPDEHAESFVELLSIANNPKFQHSTFKEMVLHVKEKGILAETPTKTLYNLFKPIIYSVEHTCPRSTGGQNSYANYLPMHISCNSERSSFSYGEMLAKNPEFIANIKKSLSQINEIIVKSKSAKPSKKSVNIPDDYIEKVKTSIQSQGISIL